MCVYTYVCTCVSYLIELTRLSKACDMFCGDPGDLCVDPQWQKYFYSFNIKCTVNSFLVGIFYVFKEVWFYSKFSKFLNQKWREQVVNWLSMWKDHI